MSRIGIVCDGSQRDKGRRVWTRKPGKTWLQSSHVDNHRRGRGRRRPSRQHHHHHNHQVSAHNCRESLIIFVNAH